MTSIDISSLLLFSAVLRVILILYGEWQDTHMEVRYTDVDYLVFSDAASFMVSGKSPYLRTTYRYSPLLAFLLMPNSIIHRSWGKFLFSASDVLVGLFIHIILKLRKVPEKFCTYSVMVWLFNPFTFTIGTRGNCEPIVCAMVLWIIICVMNGNILQAAFWFGLVVHFRIYPIIYALPIILVLDPRLFQSGQKKPLLGSWSSGQGKAPQSGARVNDRFDMWSSFTSLFARARIMFGLVAATVFFSCTGISYYLYGWEFLHEALLYLLTLLNLCYARDLPFCFFVQTVAFVAFNKAITAQYFVWFFCLLPLIMPWCNMKLKWEGLCCIFLWVGAQTHWLMWGYLLEFKGKNVFLQLWAASLVFLAANTFVLIMIIRHHRLSPVFEHASSKNAVKLE